MWDMLILLAAFCGGIGIGKARAINEDIANRTAYLQDVIHEANERAETWKRRYESLISVERE